MMTMQMDRPLPLPALFRNTALEISLLAQEPVSIDVAKLRARCKQLVGELAAALAARNVPDDVARDALYMQCGLLDEAVLAHLPPENRPQWGAFPLQVERFNQHDAGEHVFERLACYATVPACPIEMCRMDDGYQLGTPGEVSPQTSRPITIRRDTLIRRCLPPLHRPLLQRPHLREQATRAQQLCMRATLDDPAAIHHDDLLRMHDRR